MEKEIGIKRDNTFDVAKGLGIILMMLCHYVLDNNIIIYSFHMPMFFFISGYFHKPFVRLDNFKQYTINNIKRLLLPYVVTMVMLIMWGG